MIRFTKVKWSNFLSTGNAFTEILLDRSPSTLIIGDNGSGKSTLLDALTYVLFNRPFRNINKPQLVNSINKKNLMVEIEFIVNGQKYLVRRGMKPNVFEILKDGVLLNQPGSSRDYQSLLEESILKLNYKSFTQIVILGNASFTPFMQLKPSDRREVIEDLLDIQIFSQMNILLKDRMSTNKQGITENDFNITLMTEKLDLQKKFLERLRSDVNKQKSDIKEEASKLIKLRHEATDQCISLQKEIGVLRESVGDSAAFTERLEKIRLLLDKLKTKDNAVSKRITFFHNNDICPTCEEKLSDVVKVTKIATLKATSEQTGAAIDQLSAQYTAVLTKIEAINKIQESIYLKQTTVSSLNSQILIYDESVEQLRKKMADLKIDNDNDNAPTETVIRDLETQIRVAENKKVTLSIERDLYNHAQKLLKDDGIKSKIIRQYVPIINKLINKYLSSLDFFVNFELNEEFGESIKSRFRDEFSYSSFSEGEKMRIDLALMFTWRAVAKMKNSSNTNLLILDEVFDASLDPTGCEEFMKLLEETTDTNMFVISHRGDILSDKFRNQIKFEKSKNFSVMV